MGMGMEMGMGMGMGVGMSTWAWAHGQLHMRSCMRAPACAHLHVRTFMCVPACCAVRSCMLHVQVPGEDGSGPRHHVQPSLEASPKAGHDAYDPKAERSAILRLNLHAEEGLVQSVVSDKTWTSSDSPIRSDSTYFGETYDAREEQKGWATPTFVPPLGKEKHKNRFRTA